MLSIVTITYKDANGLQATCDSLKPWHALGSSWEHVVIDSSPSETKTVIEALPKDWPLVHRAVEPNGIYTAQNEGIAAARGSLLWFLNGGDLLLAPALLAQAERRLAAQVGYDLWIGGAEVRRTDGSKRRQAPPSSFRAGLVGENRICHQAVVYRRTVFQRSGAYDTSLRFAADYEHLWRLYLSGVRAILEPEPLVAFGLGGASSQMKAVFAEFRIVQERLGNRLPILARLENRLRWLFGYARISLVSRRDKK